jgi:hypothetical protein
MRANDVEKCPESRDTMSKAGFEKRAGTNAPCTIRAHQTERYARSLRLAETGIYQLGW